MQGVKMNAVAKRVSDAVMDKVTHELKPDIPTHNRLKRSWEEHEKNKQHHARNLKKEIAKIQDKVSQSIKSLASEPAPYDVNPQKESWPLTGVIPGFRYRSNGDERKGLYDDDPRRLRLVKISPGVKYVMGKTKRDDSPGNSKATLVRPSLDHVNKSDINVVENDNSADPSSHQLRKNTRSTGLLDDDAVFRCRKVQEQLGLHRKPSHIAAQSALDANNEMEQLEHALKVLSFVLRNPEMDTSLLQPPPFRSKKTLSMHRPLDYSSYRNRTASQPVLRERCVACQQVYRNGMGQLVRHSDPEVYQRPRWRAVPSGRYVSPPLFALKLSNPALHTRTELGSKTTSTTFTSRKASSSKAGLPTVSDSRSALSMLAVANTHDSAGGGGGGGGGPEDSYYTNDTSYSTAPASRVSLYALKNRNNTEAELLKKRMREFMDSLPPKEPPLVPARIKAT